MAVEQRSGRDALVCVPHAGTVEKVEGLGASSPQAAQLFSGSAVPKPGLLNLVCSGISDGFVFISSRKAWDTIPAAEQVKETRLRDSSQEPGPSRKSPDPSCRSASQIFSI